MTITYPELIVFAWCARILGALGALCLLLFAAYWLLRGYLRVVDRWRTHTAIGWLWLSIAKRDRAKLWTAAEKWGAWNIGDERRREVDAAEAFLHRRYENREAYLRATYDIPADEMSSRDRDGHLLSLVWSDGSDDGCSAKVAANPGEDDDEA